MPRPNRIVIPGTPLHITQRGVDRCATFLASEDFATYLWVLRGASRAAGCAVHAYALMTNHVHLLVTPTQVSGPARLMLLLGRRYVRYFNDRYRRTGTLWEGRYRSTTVGTDDYFFACTRYIECNPQRAGLVAKADAYPWSSFRHNACGEPDPVITAHPLYEALGPHDGARREAYRCLFATELAPRTITEIHTAPLLRRALPVTPYEHARAAAAQTTTHNPSAGRAHG